MADRDAYICDVIVIPTDQAADNMAALSKHLKENGLDVRDINTQQCVIEGTVNASKIHGLQALPDVRYVRCVYSYIADYPAGDARDVN